MPNTEQRNRKIFHLIESTVHDFCKVLECTYTFNTEAIMLQHENEVTEYIHEAEASLCFLDDTRLVMSQLIEAEYSDYAILKSKMLLELYIGAQNARRLKDKLE